MNLSKWDIKILNSAAIVWRIMSGIRRTDLDGVTESAGSCLARPVKTSKESLYSRKSPPMKGGSGPASEVTGVDGARETGGNLWDPEREVAETP